MKIRQMENLLYYPQLQDMTDSKPLSTEVALQTPIITMPNRRWIVVGGFSKGGIVVRKGEDLRTPELASRLATGALVQEIESMNDRLHYKKIKGDGPDFGWVSIFFKGTMLLEPHGAYKRKTANINVIYAF